MSSFLLLCKAVLPNQRFPSSEKHNSGAYSLWTWRLYDVTSCLCDVNINAFGIIITKAPAFCWIYYYSSKHLKCFCSHTIKKSQVDNYKNLIKVSIPRHYISKHFDSSESSFFSLKSTHNILLKLKIKRLMLRFSRHFLHNFPNAMNIFSI